MAKSEQFEQYVKLSAELQRTEVGKMTRQETLAFFINIYNALVVHANIERGPPISVWQRYKVSRWNGPSDSVVAAAADDDMYTWVITDHWSVLVTDQYLSRHFTVLWLKPLMWLWREWSALTLNKNVLGNLSCANGVSIQYATCFIYCVYVISVSTKSVDVICLCGCSCACARARVCVCVCVRVCACFCICMPYPIVLCSQFFNTVSYNIGGQLYCLQDIENGVLRANRKGVGQVRAPFSRTDPRLCVSLDRCEPLIHFALVCGAKSCPPIKTYTAPVSSSVHESLWLCLHVTPTSSRVPFLYLLFPVSPSLPFLSFLADQHHCFPLSLTLSSRSSFPSSLSKSMYGFLCQCR